VPLQKRLLGLIGKFHVIRIATRGLEGQNEQRPIIRLSDLVPDSAAKVDELAT
jgi:hypothetical protein